MESHLETDFLSTTFLQAAAAMMYNGSGSFNNGGQCPANGFQTPYNPAAAAATPMNQFPVGQQTGMWPQQQQQQQQQQQPGYDRFYNSYNNGATSNSFAASQQQQQQQFAAQNNPASVNASMPQWNSQAWNSWQPPQQPQQQAQQQQQQQQQPALPQQQQQASASMPQHQAAAPMNGVTNHAGSAAAAAPPVVKRCDVYQRTFDYVQQCQNWTSQQ